MGSSSGNSIVIYDYTEYIFLSARSMYRGLCVQAGNDRVLAVNSPHVD